MEGFNLVRLLTNYYIANNSLSTIKVYNDKENTLYPHQYKTLNFIYENLEKNLGCVLDHDSNMGKTVSICVFLNNIIKNSKRNKALIICTEDLVEYWLNHLTRWSQLKICKYHEDDQNLNDFDVVITSIKIIKSMPYTIWPIIIFDEADSLINSRGIRLYRQGNESIKIALTNIRAQKPSNSIKFWNLLSFVTTPNFNRESFLRQCQLKPEQVLEEFNISYYQRLSWLSYSKYKFKFLSFNQHSPKPPKSVKNSPKKTIKRISKVEKKKNIPKINITILNKEAVTFGEDYFHKENECFMTPNYYKLRKYFDEKTKSITEKSKDVSEMSFNENKASTSTSNFLVEPEDNNSKGLSQSNTDWTNIFEKLIKTKPKPTTNEQFKSESEKIPSPCEETEEISKSDDWNSRFEKLIKRKY